MVPEFILHRISMTPNSVLYDLMYIRMEIRRF